jgi:hypothetical protein
VASPTTLDAAQLQVLVDELRPRDRWPFGLQREAAQYILDRARGAFADVLRTYQSPRLERVRWDIDVYYDGLRFDAVFSGPGYVRSWMVPSERAPLDLMSEMLAVDGQEALQLLWRQMVRGDERATGRRAVAAPPDTTMTVHGLRDAYRLLREEGVPSAYIERARRDLERHMVDHAERTIMGVDLAREPDRTVFHQYEPGAINLIEDYDRIRHMQAGALARAYGFYPEPNNSTAVARGQKLLREWLSPAQLADYDGRGSFEVIGNVTKRRYRINRGTVYNVTLVDVDGSAIVDYCFRPAGNLQGNLVAGDVMLAQKLALEQMEQAALAAANSRPAIDRSRCTVTFSVGHR